MGCEGVIHVGAMSWANLAPAGANIPPLPAQVTTALNTPLPGAVNTALNGVLGGLGNVNAQNTRNQRTRLGGNGDVDVTLRRQ